MVEFHETSDNFLDWFRSWPGTTFHPSLKIADLRTRDAGRGILATADIPPETDLFTIPRSAILSAETSELAHKLPKLFAEQPNDRADADEDESRTELPKSWMNLIMIIIYESLHCTTSKWAPYISVLPSKPSQFNTLMFWTPQELSALQASNITNKIGKDSADKMFRERVIPTVKKHADIFYPAQTTHQSDEQLLEKCHVIGSLIMSYAFDLQPDEDDEDEDEDGEDGWIEDRPNQLTLGMVPMADMLNADAEFNAHLSHGDDALTMTSLREIEAGEEVLNYYGPLPNAELLRRYGYTSSKHSRYDVVEVGWGLVKEILEDSELWEGLDEMKARRITAKLEEDGEIDESDGFILEREAGDPDEQGLCPAEAKFMKFPHELVSLVGVVISKMLESEFKKRKLQGDDQERLLKHRMLVVFEKLASTRLSQFETGIEEDQLFLEEGDIKGRQRMAIKVRLGEKRILQEALEWIKEMQKKYEESETAKSSKSKSVKAVKKQKR